ncbi:MAG: DUF2786 domain-containing protein [Enterovibrio sp.]
MIQAKHNILKKIAKCLELSNSSNINEAAQAIKMAHSLMKKYGLEQDDIYLFSIGKTYAQTLLPTAIPESVIRIIRTINRQFGVECVLTNYKGLKRAEFIGSADRAVFAGFALDIFYREMNEKIGQFRNRFQGSGLSLQEVNRKVLSFSRGWLDGSLEKLPMLVKDDDINQRIKSYIDSQFKNLDRETFKKQLKEAMNTITGDYETGVKKGRQLSVIRPIGRADELKRLS